MAALSASNRAAAALRGAMLPAVALSLILLMVVPIPAVLLDVGFASNIMLSLAVLIIAMNVARPLDFSSFPTVLLLATLFRLALNVASTRVVLMNGHEGPDAAGHVIEAFGNFLLGGDYLVGIFVFAILLIINLVVITKGAGRVSEVSARFVLDAMPGKQMAIDADLGAGLLTADEARTRRAEVATEADFYGSMDGASKFVKGDAVAGLLILAINIIGGLAIGTLVHGLSLSDAASTYILLAIGDALVAQVPALLLSVAAATIVTRVTSGEALDDQIAGQFSSFRAWVPVACIMAVIGLIPGMPHLLMLAIAGIAAGIAWASKRAATRAAAPPPPAPVADPARIDWDDLRSDGTLRLDLGIALVGMVDPAKGAPLMKRLTGVRRDISRELGFVVPMTRVADNLALGANSYRLSIGGSICGEGEVWPDDLFALEAGPLMQVIPGREAIDPAFGLPARWIDKVRRAEASVAGYTVVDAPTVIATHFDRALRLCAADLFGLDEAHALVELLRQDAPQLVANLTPQPLPLPLVASVARALLAEGIPLTDFRTIAQAMVDAARLTSEPAELVEQVRQRIGRIIVQTIVDPATPLPVLTLDARLEAIVADAVRIAPQAQYPVEPSLARRIVEAAVAAVQPLMADNRSAALVVAPGHRRVLARILGPHLPETRVLSFLELPETKAVEVIAIIGGEDPAPQIDTRPLETANGA